MLPASAMDLPSELILAIFESVVVLYDSSTAYKILLNFSGVCKQWADVAQKVLLSQVEITRRDQAIALLNFLDSAPSRHKDLPYIESFILGVGRVKNDTLIDENTLLRLLSYTPRLRQLVILHHAGFGCVNQLPPLPYLTDVTITASGTAPAPLTEISLIQQLPSQVRFLHLPGAERTRCVSPPSLPPPSLELFGLTVQEYPSTSTKWTLANSGLSLQCLSVAYLATIDQLAESHPNLRSLKIMNRVNNVSLATGFQPLASLQRLELRDLSAKAQLIDTLPQALEYFRFWSTELALGLVASLSAGAHPMLKTVVWDYYFPATGPIGFESVTGDLQEVCRKRGIELRLYERKDGGRRASKGADHQYESDLRRACFARSGLRSHDILPSRLPSRIMRDLHNGPNKAGAPLAPQFKSISPFMDGVPGLWTPVWEECFEGHGEWLEQALPRMEAERKAKLGEPSSSRCAVRPGQPVAARDGFRMVF